MLLKLNFIIVIMMIINLNPIISETKKLFDRFDVYRVSSDFHGSVYDGNVIIVFGTGGVMLRSTDLGKNWEQINIDDRFNIIGMELIDGILYGLTNLNYVIKSENSGKSWSSYELEPNYRFKQLSSYNKQLFCMTDTQIIIYSTNLTKIREYNLQTDTNHYEFTIAGNTLFYPVGKGKILAINLSNHQERLIDMKSTGFCTDCELPKNIFSLGNSIYFNLDNRLYSYDGNKFKTAFYSVAYGKYCVYNSDIYQIYNVFNKSTNLDSLYFIKANLETGFFQHVKKRENDRYITNLKINDVRFIDENTIIAVGANKLIYMSHDKGINWNLVSVMPQWIQLINRMNENVAYHIFSKGQFTITTNGGITWLSQSNYDPIYLSEEFNDVLNVGLIADLENKVPFYYAPTIKTDSENILFSNDLCETVSSSKSLQGYLTIHKPNFVKISNNNIVSIISRYKNNNYTALLSIDDEFNVIDRSIIDSTHVYSIENYKDKMLIAICKVYKSPDSIDITKFHNIYYKVIVSQDLGQTWEDISVLNLESIITNYATYSFVDDNLFFNMRNNPNPSSANSVYCFNILNHSLEEIFIKPTIYLNNPGIVKYQTDYYFSGYTRQDKLETHFYVNSDFYTEPSNWQNIMPKSRYSNIQLFTYPSDLIKITAYDSLAGHYVVWFNKSDSGTSVIETNTETSDLTLYLSKPYPLPAREFVQVRLYWDKNKSIDKAIFTVSNLLGEVVSSSNQFMLNIVNEYSAELIWYPPNIQAGIYFITVRIGQSTKTIPILIS